MRTKLKDIQSGKIIDETFNAGHKLEFIRVEAKSMQFLYVDGENHIFMDNETFEQINLNNDVLEILFEEGFQSKLFFILIIYKLT